MSDRTTRARTVLVCLLTSATLVGAVTPATAAPTVARGAADRATPAPAEELDGDPFHEHEGEGGPERFVEQPDDTPADLTDLDGPADWTGSPPDPADVPAEWLVGLPPEPAPEAPAPSEAALGRAGVSVPAPPTPTTTLPTVLDAHPGWQYTYSCDPVTRPGITAFGTLLGTHYARPRFYTSRACVAGDNSQHYEGRAVDWPMDAYDPQDKAIGDSVAAWLTADDGAMARRFGIMMIIWNRQIWYTHRPAQWSAYSGVSPHTDHLHFSFTWDGAMKRTSWWTGTAVTTVDHGTCRVYSGQYAPRYTGPRGTACTTTLPAAPVSPYPVYLPGAKGSHISLAQGYLGLTPDGVFGSTMLSNLMSYQAKRPLPVTGVLDNATWARMLAVLPVAPYQQMIASPDVSGDGWGDALVVDAVGRLHVYPGAGAGRLGTVRSLGTGWGRLSIYAPGDWDGDGRGDLVAVGADGKLWLYPGNGAGGFAAAREAGFGWTGLRIVPAGDVNGDGAADLLAIDDSGVLWLYPGLGDGRFGRRGQVGNGWGTFALHAAGDMNRDGKVDILGIDADGRLWFYRGLGRGIFAKRVNVGYGWNGYGFASGGDFNRDGVNDLLGRDPGGAVWFYAGTTSGGFGKRTQTAQGW